MGGTLNKALHGIAADLIREVAFYRLLLAHPRTPWTAKALVSAALAYAFSPVDLIPDVIPVIGYLDDLVVVPALVWAAMRLVPREVVKECRRTAAATRAGDRANP
jgi:uncharacterized membrane protein YkvA (DUF1232 family)